MRFLIILFVLMLSCTTKNSVNKVVLHEIYFKEVEMCKSIILEPNIIDSLKENDNIILNSFIEMYNNGYYNSLGHFTKQKKIELLDIKRYEVTNSSLFLKVHNLKIVFLIVKDNITKDVMSFQFHFDKDRFKLHHIETNPYDYYEYRSPKVKPYYPLMPPID